MFLSLEKAIVDLFKANSSWLSVSGGTIADPRIYAWSPAGDIVFTPGSIDVAVIYRTSVTGRPGRWSYPFQIPDMQLFFRLISIDQFKLGTATEILIGQNFLDQESIETNDVSVKTINLLSVNDGLNEGAPTQPIHTRNFSFRLSNVFIRLGVRQQISSLDAILIA
jgi:hypothetical protein